MPRIATETTDEFFTRNQLTFDKWAKYQQMTADEYAVQLAELIDHASADLPERVGTRVLVEAFDLIRIRLGIKIQSKWVLPEADGQVARAREAV